MSGTRCHCVLVVAAHLGDQEWWTRSEVAEYLGVDPKTVTAYVTRRQPKSDPIPLPIMFGGRPVWRPEDIRAWHARRPGRGRWGKRPWSGESL